MTEAQALLVTGRPGCGKTTLVRKAVDRARCRAGGFYTQEVRDAGARVGFEIVTLDGQRAVLSHVRFTSPHRVSRYGVDVQALERVGVSALRRATRSGGLVVVDEIGKMELCSAAFCDAVREALDLGVKVLGSIMLARHPWADTIKGDARVKVLPLARENWRDVFEAVVAWLGDGGSTTPADG